MVLKQILKISSYSWKQYILSVMYSFSSPEQYYINFTLIPWLSSLGCISVSHFQRCLCNISSHLLILFNLFLDALYRNPPRLMIHFLSDSVNIYAAALGFARRAVSCYLEMHRWEENITSRSTERG